MIRGVEMNAKRHLVWAFLMFIGLLSFSSMSLAEKGPWTRKADMPTPRNGHSTSAVNGKIYAIGGFDEDEILSTVEEYDPVTDLGVEIEAKGKLVTGFLGQNQSPVVHNLSSFNVP